MDEYDRESEEVDVTPFEGVPDFEDSPTKQTDLADGQDDGELDPGPHEVEQLPPLDEGQALGDDLAPPEPRDA